MSGVDIKTSGTSRFKVNASGSITVAGAITSSSTISSGAITARADTDALFVKSVTNQNAAEIAFSSQGPSTYAQIGRISYQHGDTLAYGGTDVFTIRTTESAPRILADGLLMFKSGLALKPASGTGAGTTLITSSRALQNITSISCSSTISSGAITSSGEIDVNLSAEGKYFEGGSGNIRRLSITSGTNVSAHAKHTFDIASSNGKYVFQTNAADRLTLDSSGATFAGTISSGAITSTTGTFISATNSLRVISDTGGSGSNINFSDQGAAGAQQGNIFFRHFDSLSYGSGASFTLSSTEPTTTILADGKLMFKEGLYIKPSSGTAAGTLLISSSGNLTNIGTITATGLVIADRFYSGLGTAASPAFKVGDADSGFYDSGANMVGLSLGGILEYDFQPTLLDLKNNTLTGVGDLTVGGGSSGAVARFKGANYNQINIAHSGNTSWGMLLTNSNSTSNGNYHYSTSGAHNSIAVVNVNNDALHFGTNNDARMTIDHGGDVFILNGVLKMGSTTVIDGSRNVSAAKITTTTASDNAFSGDIVINKSQPYIVIQNTTEDNGGIVFNDLQAGAWPAASSQQFRMQFTSGAGNNFTMGHESNYSAFTFARTGIFTAVGNITAYSDERLKENIQTLDGKKVLQMRGVSFTKDGQAGSGVIAQELELVASELVHTADDEMGTKSVAYGNLVGYLIENAKQQQSEIDELKALVKTLMEK